jgi:hypothetical protein
MHVQGQYGLTQAQIEERRRRLKELRALSDAPEPPHMDYSSPG